MHVPTEKLISEQGCIEQIKKPSPIHVNHVINFNQLIILVNKIAEGAEFYCKSTIDKITIISSTPILYCTIFAH